MDDELWVDGNRVDAASQKILWTMRDGEWKYGLPLREAAGLDENRQVFYRMEEHLKPAGLVAEASREDQTEARQFGLTEAGATWVGNNGERLQAPTSREEMAEQAQEGYEAGISAKESVQNYRKKVNRIKENLNEIEETVEKLELQQETDTNSLDYLDERSRDSRDRSKKNEKNIKNLSTSLEERATTEKTNELRDDLTNVEREVHNLSAKQSGLVRQQARAEYDRTRLFGLARPAGYLVVGAMMLYFVVLAVSVLIAPELVASVVVAGIAGLVGVTFGTGIAIYARGWETPLRDIFGDDDDAEEPSATAE